MTRRVYPDMHGWSNTWKPMNIDSHVDQFKKKKKNNLNKCRKSI